MGRFGKSWRGSISPEDSANTGVCPTDLSIRRRKSRLLTCSFTPAFDEARAAFELYPKTSIRAWGTAWGRKLSSCSQKCSTSPSFAVHVDFALELVLKGLRPCTATILQTERNHQQSLTVMDLCFVDSLYLSIIRIDNYLEEVP
jgi:hypothetical protein